MSVKKSLAESCGIMAEVEGNFGVITTQDLEDTEALCSLHQHCMTHSEECEEETATTTRLARSLSKLRRMAKQLGERATDRNFMK